MSAQPTRALLCVLVVTSWLSGTAWGQGKAKAKAAKSAPKADKADTAAVGEGASAEPNKPGKTRELNFSGLDIEGKLKTPQLLYFLNRVRVELDSSTPGKRSFMKELERSADDKGL